VIGATGLQGGGVVEALRQQGRFKIRALTRNPDAYSGPADEVRLADMEKPETLVKAFEGAYGAFVVTNFWEGGGGKIDEVAQATAAVDAARQAGVQHLIWSSLPNVEVICSGKYYVPHFSDKARVNAHVEAAGFRFHTFVEAPGYYQSLFDSMAPQQLEDGSKGWLLPIDPARKCIHVGDISQLGLLVAGALVHPEKAGSGQRLALAGDFVSFNDIVDAFAELGHSYSFTQWPADDFSSFFPGAAETADSMKFFEECSYCGPDADTRIELAKQVSSEPFTDLATWLKRNISRYL